MNYRAQQKIVTIVLVVVIVIAVAGALVSSL